MLFLERRVRHYLYAVIHVKQIFHGRAKFQFILHDLDLRIDAADHFPEFGTGKKCGFNLAIESYGVVVDEDVVESW